jgi:hypothetical protein
MSLNELQSIIDCQNQSNKFKIINTAMPMGTVGVDYNISPIVVTSGGNPTCSTPPVAPCVFNVTGLPSGLSYTAGTNKIAGKPTQSGIFSLSLTATNGKADDNKTVALVISEPVAAESSSGSGYSLYDICMATCTLPGNACEAQCKDKKKR